MALMALSGGMALQYESRFFRLDFNRLDERSPIYVKHSKVVMWCYLGMFFSREMLLFFCPLTSPVYSTVAIVTDVSYETTNSTYVLLYIFLAFASQLESIQSIQLQFSV